MAAFSTGSQFENAFGVMSQVQSEPAPALLCYLCFAVPTGLSQDSLTFRETNDVNP